MSPEWLGKIESIPEAKFLIPSAEHLLCDGDFSLIHIEASNRRSVAVCP